MDWLKSVNSIIKDYPDTPHEIVVKRALERRKPFNISGKSGYRDTLIWETILDIVSKDNTPMAFITGNIKDFTDSTELLHQDLLEDLRSLGMDKPNVILYTNFASFVDEEIQPNLELLSEIVSNLEEGEFDGLDLYDFLYGEFATLVSEEDLEPSYLGLPSGFETLNIWNIEKVHTIFDIDVRKLGDDKLLISFSTKLDAGIDYFIFKRDYDLYYLDKQEMVEIWDSDWNEWYAWAYSFVSNLRMKISLVFIPEESEVKSVDLIDYESKFNPDKWELLDI